MTIQIRKANARAEMVSAAAEAALRSVCPASAYSRSHTVPKSCPLDPNSLIPVDDQAMFSPR